MTPEGKEVFLDTAIDVPYFAPHVAQTTGCVEGGCGTYGWGAAFARSIKGEGEGSLPLV